MTTTGTSARRPTTRSTVLVVLGILLVAANLRPALTSVGPVLPGLRADLGVGATAAGVLAALPLVAFAVVALVTPALGRAVGVERALVLGLVLLVAGSALRSLTGEAGLFVGTAVLAVGIGVANVLLPALVRSTVPDRVGLVTSWYAATLTLMAAAASGLSAPIAQATSGGWRTALGVWALLAAVTTLVWAPSAVRRRSRPAPPAPHGTAPGRTASPWRSSAAWAVALYFAFQSAIFYSVVSWLPTVLLDRGLGATSAGLHLLGFQVAGLLSGLALPLALRGRPDERGVSVLAAVCALAGTATLAALPDVTSLWTAAATWAAVLATGAGIGGMFTLSLTLIALRAADGAGAGALSAMAQSSGYLVGAVGPVAVGALRATTGTWTWSLVLLAALAAVGVLAGRRAGIARTVG